MRFPSTPTCAFAPVRSPAECWASWTRGASVAGIQAGRGSPAGDPASSPSIKTLGGAWRDWSVTGFSHDHRAEPQWCVCFLPRRENVISHLSDHAFDRPICEVLLNQKYFNGIGNYLRAEILFRWPSQTVLDDGPTTTLPCVVCFLRVPQVLVLLVGYSGSAVFAGLSLGSTVFIVSAGFLSAWFSRGLSGFYCVFCRFCSFFFVCWVLWGSPRFLRISWVSSLLFQEEVIPPSSHHCSGWPFWPWAQEQVGVEFHRPKIYRISLHLVKWSGWCPSSRVAWCFIQTGISTSALSLSNSWKQNGQEKKGIAIKNIVKARLLFM